MSDIRKNVIRDLFLLFLIISLGFSADKNINEQSIITDISNDIENNSDELFELLFSEAKSYYVEALISGHFKDTSEVKYCFDRSFEAIAEIGELDTLNPLQKDDFNRFCEKISNDFQIKFSYLNGDSGAIGAAFIREEINQTVLDTVRVGWDTLVVLDDRPGHLPIVTSQKIEHIIEFFVEKEHKRFQEWLDNAGLYREHMLPILRKYGLPDELFYLALIESGYNPLAYSYAHAAGPWQFIAGTGARYGLKRNWWMDERRDPIKSTYAAAKYLRELCDEFDDWFLALAAYNCGELRVWRAIRWEGTRDYWKLRSLPRQTRNYIPTLMAGIIIALNPQKYGFENTPKDTWLWDEVVLNRCYELEDIAKVSGISAKDLRDYNPELRRWTTPPGEKKYTLRVPKGKSKGLADKLAKLPDIDKKPQWITHRVRRGQTLSYIARKYGTSISSLVAANSIRNKNQIKVGQKLQIPANNYRAAVYSTSSKKNKIVHVVKKGETLSEIAEKYHVGLSKIRSWNRLYGKRFIYPGQRLQIFTSSKSSSSKKVHSGKGKIIHVVKKGETLYEIADLYNVSLSKLRSWNKLLGKRFIYPGQKLVIYKSSSG
ncbi:MAG: LysM peptidoglycan-binding domain-containing protein [Candidatus Marinimicrobia bacterium]|nr:LysM peptidoglycan-binding domain-containing protein [Candidatus Neomarinimicrobiota bacterium]